MRFLRPVLAAALLVGGGTLIAEAQADSPARPPMRVAVKNVQIDMKDFSFPSGMRIIFQEEHSQPVVQLVMTIDHGAQDDPQGLEGIAHLIEHLWFRSIHPDNDGKDLPKVWDILGQMGAQINATTSTDRTNYLTVARSPLVQQLMNLEAIRVRGEAVRKVTADDVLVEREVVRNELRLRMENDSGDIFRYLFDKMWPKGHPYNRETIGTHDSLNAITLADIQKYVKDYYLPSESTLVVTGDFQPSQIDPLLQAFTIDQLAAKNDPEGKNLTMVPPKVRIPTTPVEPPVPAKPIEVKGEVSGLETFYGGVEKQAIVIGWTMPSGYTANDALANAAVQQLNIAIQQELFPDWEYTVEDSAANDSSVGCFSNPGRYGGSAICWIETDDDEPAKVVERALNGVYTLWTRDEAMGEFQKMVYSYSQQQSLAGTLFLADEVFNLFAGRATMASDFAHYTGDPLFFARSMEWGTKFSIDEVRNFAEKYFKRERAVAIVMKPYEDGMLTMDGSDSQYRGQSRDASVLTMFDDSQVTEEVLKETIIVPDTKKIVQETLPNGMRLVVLPHGAGPMVHTSLVFDGGSDSAGLDYAQAVFARNNWSLKTPEIVNPLRIAGDAGISFGAFGASFDVSGSAANMAEVAYLARYRLDNLEANTDGKLDWVKAGKKAILRSMKKPQDAAPLIQNQRLWTGHSFGTMRTHQDWDALDKMSVADAKAFFSRVLRPKNATYVVVGNVTPEEARTAAKTYLAGWAGWGKEPAGWTVPTRNAPTASTLPDRQVILFNKENASQTDVSYGCRITPLTAETEWAAQVMADVMGDGLWLALREQTGASYGAGSYVSTTGGLSELGMGVQVQNDQTGYAVKTFLETGEKAKAKKLDDRLVATRKFSGAQAYVIGQATASSMLQRLVGTRNRGWGYDYYDTIAGRIAKVSQKDFAAILEPCVGHEVVTAVGPVALIKPQFEKLGIPVEVFDVDAYRKDYRAKMGLPEEKVDKKKDEKKK